MQQINGDFGIKSAIVVAASEEPEYKGVDTLVIPLHIPKIPKGAIPIRYARIPRSGKKNEAPVPTAEEILDLTIAQSSDQLFAKRVGSPGITRPRVRNPIPQRQFSHVQSGPSSVDLSNRKSFPNDVQNPIQKQRENRFYDLNVVNIFGDIKDKLQYCILMEK